MFRESVEIRGLYLLGQENYSSLWRMRIVFSGLVELQQLVEVEDCIHWVSRITAFNVGMRIVFTGSVELQQSQGR